MFAGALIEDMDADMCEEIQSRRGSIWENEKCQNH